MKKETLLASMPKMVLIITMVVMLGSLFGAVSYLLLKTPKIDLPIVNPVVEEVVIVTDKTEYETGEIVKMKIKNNSNEDLTYVLAIESFENGSWDKIVEDTRCDCGFNNCVKLELFVEANSERKYPWNQEWGLCDELPLGQKLRVEMIYGEKRKPGEGRKGDSKIIYSNEFTINTIKEKSAVDARCEEKSQLLSDCPAFSRKIGYEFDSNRGKCIERFVEGNGCDIICPFETLEECQEVCEKKADTSDWQTHRNEEFGFEMEYPEELTFSKDTMLHMDRFGNENYEISIRVFPKRENLNYEIVKETSRYKKIDFNNYQAIRDVGLGIYYFDTIRIYHDKYYYELIYANYSVKGSSSEDRNKRKFSSLTNEEKIDIEKYEIVFDQILSSFKFIEK